jgi:predicted ATP-dependent serine protease
MKINLQSTSFTAVKDIQIPDIYNRRVKSGIPEVDDMFGGGMLPGSITTISSKAGVGKSTMVLQILDGMTKSGHNVGFVSAEESIHQVAFACRRLGITNVGICNESNLKKIISFMDDVDVIVIDSFHAIDRKDMEEKHAIEALINKAKETECVVIIICHLTKGGDIKGNNLLTYAVDVNIFIEMGELPDLRRVYFTKNRFGPGIDYTCSFTSRGYDFTAVTATTADGDDKKSKKTERKEKAKSEILKLNGQFSVTDVCDVLDVDATRAGYLLRELTLEGKLKKNNKRGTQTRWKVNKIEATITKH